ncbi:unnamed protein product [Mytilus edulis]|uniref:Uncharacterized protein n=1 Tax=Mytilus edulis TaxID=6550 RepID=A0A8S3SYN6_MYTED|nr:unnamed protein product [Mytilus edulis]
MPVKKYLMCLYLSVSLHTSYSFPVEDSPKNLSSIGYEPVSFDLSKFKVDTTTSQQQTHLLDIEFKQKKERVSFISDECHFNFNRSDTESAKRYVANELLKPDDVFAFYIFLNAKNSNKRSKEYFDDIDKLNGLQEWIWLESSMTFNVLKSPIDIGAVTFTISKYGTRNVWLEWTLPDTCGPNNLIGYYNESNRLISYILDDVIENSTMKDSYLCHRNFNCDTSFIEWCWWITTVWIGYDYNCYPIKTLREGKFGSILISKTDLSKLLTFVVGLIGYMHPFLWHILESVQLWSTKKHERRELRKYYKDTSKIEKPYGYVRVLQKIFFRSDEYLYPIISFFAFSTFVLFAFNLFKLLNIRHEMFEEDGYDNFPNVYRFGVPEYTSLNRWITFPVSVVAYFVCNIWIYIRYNKYNKEFIICIPNYILGRSWRVDPDENTDNSAMEQNASDLDPDKEKVKVQ